MPFMLNASALGRQASYRLEPGELVIDSASGERRVPFTTIARVHLAKLGAMTSCELRLTDGTTRMIANEDAAARADCEALVLELHRQLAEGPTPVAFVRGSWALVGLLTSIGALVAGLGVALTQGWITVGPALQSKAAALQWLGLTWVVLGPLIVIRSIPRRYDPRAPPRELL
jgi:hypothetical protein